MARRRVSFNPRSGGFANLGLRSFRKGHISTQKQLAIERENELGLGRPRKIPISRPIGRKTKTVIKEEFFTINPKISTSKPPPRQFKNIIPDDAILTTRRFSGFGGGTARFPTIPLKPNIASDRTQSLGRTNAFTPNRLKNIELAQQMETKNFTIILIALGAFLLLNMKK